MTRRWIASVWIALLLPAAHVEAQLVEGDRVRIGFINGGGVTGTFAESTPTALVLYRGGIPIAVPRAQIGEMERSLGKRGDFGRNLLVSVGASALIVGGMAALVTDPSEPCDMFCGRQSAFVLGAIGGGVIGVPIGLIAGIASYQERWERLPLSTPNGFSLLLGYGALGVAFRLPLDGAFPGQR